MTNARFWVEDSDLVTERWKDRTDALARYYERQLAAGWPKAGESSRIIFCALNPSGTPHHVAA